MPASLARGWSPLYRAAGLALAATCTALSVVLFVELKTPVAPAGAAPSAQAETPDTTGNNAAPRYALPPLQDFAAVTERPLFSEDRQPSPDGDGQSIGPLSSVQVAGIIISPDARVAVVSLGNPPVFVHLREGQDVDGWVVRSIEPNHVVFRNGAEVRELQLLKKSGRDAENSSNDDSGDKMGDASDDNRAARHSLNWRDE
jgi:hypothetical protein